MKLIDLNSRGKDREWGIRKKANIQLANMMKLTDSLKKKSDSVLSCSNYLIFKECQNDGFKHLEHAMFCQDRFCPICAWRRSLRLMSSHIGLYTTVLERYKNSFHYMLTLTVQNCNVGELKDTIIFMQDSWNRISQRAYFKKNFDLGYLKVLEITRNDNKYSQWHGTMHPHYHTILSSTLLVDDIVKMAEKLKIMWLESMHLDKDSGLYKHYQEYLQIEIHKIENIIDTSSNNTNSENISINAIAEISKYTMKMSNLYVENTIEEKAGFLQIIYEQLRNVRNISYGGEIAKIAKELKLEEKENDLIHIEDEEVQQTEICKKCGSVLYQVIYKYDYNKKDYFTFVNKEEGVEDG